jgi:hypothetical protein
MIEDRRRFVDRLATEFAIPDPEPLFDAIADARQAYEDEFLMGRGGRWTEGYADALDEIGRADLWHIIDMIRETSHRIAPFLVGDPESMDRDESEISKVEDRLGDMCDTLAEVARVVELIPRSRRGRGNRKDGLDAVRKAMEVVVGYWTLTLGRKFEQNHTAWEDGAPMEKAPAALRFAHRVIEHILPGRGRR